MKQHIQRISFQTALIFLFILSACNTPAQVQTLLSKGNYFRIYAIEDTALLPVTVELPEAINGLCFEIDSDCTFDSSIFITPYGDTSWIVDRNPIDGLLGKQVRISNMVTFNQPIEQLTIYYRGKCNQLRIHAYITGQVQLPKLRRKNDSTDAPCTEPSMIPPSVWRAGLNEPRNSPSSTPTEHIIIHHTFDDNNVTDYIAQIRNIYIYHTVSNGWDDIAYNYLIAGDGTIFIGRDGKGIVPTDFVRGAHYCAKNSYTMGISMIGTFIDRLPTDTALASLRQLMLWKLAKDDLNPLNSFPHPHGQAGAPFLPVICGHRDGCSTDCPGQTMYDYIPTLRQQINEQVQHCKGYTKVSDNVWQQQPVAAHINDQLLTAQIDDTKYNGTCILLMTSITGNNIIKKQLLSEQGKIQTSVPSLAQGLYMIQIVTPQQQYRTKIVIRN